MKSVNIKYYKLSKKDFLSEVPLIVYKLRYDYKFYFIERYIPINKPLYDVIERKYDRNIHKIIAYKMSNLIWVVVYTNKFVSVYYCEESYNYTNLMKKLKCWYNKANEDLESKEMEEIWMNYKKMN